jgi:tetratricopeptide (TPR) repeat protein
LRLRAAAIREATRDFKGAQQCFDEGLKIWPDSQNFVEGKAWVYQELGKLDEADALLKNVHPTKENPADTICRQAILRRQPASAIPLWQNWLDQSEESSAGVRSYYLELLGDLQRLSGNVVAATRTYSQARDKLEQALKDEPANADWIYEDLARAYAGLGDRQRAMTFIDKAINSTWDPTYRSSCEETRARIAARFGQAEVAIPILERLLHTAYYNPITPALLRLHPDFDLLRGDPRFQKLVSESEPK